ncbi:MAG: UvrD-helicase domain-containing protein, partial [Clostridia bacterium]|nr:UvrD-helicase domain-containing protein [Clostridia bacterium]
TAEYTELLYRVLSEYEKRISHEKRQRGILDFSDIRRYTYRLLLDENGHPTEIAKQYAEEFSDIYIDEYQDVDLVQDQIFASIALPNNRFMVGDIKQSIYGFRGAEPKVFSDYRSRFPDYESEEAKSSDEATIFMSENFRCDEPIIDFTNLVCGKIFSACTESIGYQRKDDLVYGKGVIEPREKYAPLVEVAVISTKVDPEDTLDEGEDPPVAKELEAAYIAEEIDRLIHTEKKANGEAILPGDIAVLFRSRTMSPYVANALKQRGILSSESDGSKFFENPDVLMILCLLNTVDNPHRDIFLTGTLRSPLFGFNMNDLLEIRNGASSAYSLYDALLFRAKEENELGEKCRRFDETLQALRRDARAMPVDRFLRILFESDQMIASGLVSDSTSDSNGGNLLRLYEYARTFEAGSFKGLYNFIEFINTLIEEEKTMKIPPKGSSPDRVNLMTIHQSKGLEFPVCFVCGTASTFNRQDQRASLLFEYPSGVAMKISDTTGFARINTPMREALSIQNGIAQSEEEMRVLYVALTRARERLYVTASTAKAAEKLEASAKAKAAFCDRYTLLRCNSYLDWILLPFADSDCDTSCAKLFFVTPSEIKVNEETEIKEDVSIVEDVTADAELLEKLKKSFAFQYPYRDLQRIPAKISVSRLSPDVLDEHDDSIDLFSEKKTQVPDFFLSDRPTSVDPTERGTATHLFLQFCDFEYAERNGAQAELDRLVVKKFLPENLAKILYLEELEAFLVSDLFKKIKCASKIIREQRFNLLLSPKNFTKDQKFFDQLGEEKLAVQGVIDLILIDENGEISLFDYKTDRLSKAERADPTLAQKTLQRRHGLQLSYYTHAIEELFGRKCKKVCVYATHTGKLFDITPTPLTFSDDLLDKL